MGELKDDQEPRKRKREPAPDHYEFVNDFATYSEPITSSAPTSRSSGLPNTNEGDGHKPKKFRNDFAPYASVFTSSASTFSSGLLQNASSPNEGDDGHNTKKIKTYHAHLSASATLKADSSSSLLSAPTSPKKGAQDIAGSSGFSTPTSISGKFNQFCSPSISPLSVLSPQNSMISTAVGPSALVPSLADKANSLDPRGEDVIISNGDQLDSALAQRLFEHSTTKGFFNKLKTDLQPILVKRMKEVSQLKPTSDVGLEMADSAYLLKLLNYSNPQLETAGKKAFNGAMLLQEGMSLIAKAQEILLSAVFESSASED